MVTRGTVSAARTVDIAPAAEGGKPVVHDREAQAVAVIASGMAAQLGITTLETSPAIFIGKDAFTVIGIVDEADRKPDVPLSVVVPRTTAERVWGEPQPRQDADLHAARRRPAGRR
ncbi:hypothetical protein RKD23_004544 [Streptomyces sp. SAI-170]